MLNQTHSNLFIGLFLSVFVMWPFQSAGATLNRNAIHITQAPVPPDIDGLLKDAVWQRARFFDQFLQQSPTPFAPPKNQTAFAVAYDASHLYVAVRCFVDNMDNISSRLIARDRDGDFDKVELIISPMDDGENAYGFLVNPDGISQDGVWINDSTFDRNWDANWQVATARFENQWTAEFAIPWDQMRFADNLEQLGIQIRRWNSRKHELVVFNPKPAGVPGDVSRTGLATGIRRLSPRLPFSFRPEFVTSYTMKDSGSESTVPTGGLLSVGGYARAGIAPGWTLDLALHPDFGEVEMDSAQINLTNIETVYVEKRPFFLENRQLFDTPIQQFYSRRLGGPPALPDVKDNETVVVAPLTAPIALATKFSGKNSRGFSLGFMHVLSAPTRVEIRDDDTWRTRTVSASFWTHDNVIRLNKMFPSGSNIGLLITGHTPENHTDAAYTGGADWRIFWKEKEYVFKGQIVASGVQPDDETDSDLQPGLGLYARLGRQGGNFFRPSIQYEYRSVDFDINDMGYLDRNNIQKLSTYLDFPFTSQSRWYYELYTGMSLSLGWNQQGQKLERTMEAYLRIKWRNRMWTYLGAYGNLARYDDMEFSDGPALRRIPGGGGWLNVVTPEDRPIGAVFDANFGTDDTGYYVILKPTLQLRLGRVESELYYRLVRARDRESYADTVYLDGEENEYIVSKRNQLESDVGFKSTIILARYLSVEFNTQLLASKAHYHDFRHLLADSREMSTDYRDNPDFGKTIWNSQLLLKYEFHPQSFIYLLYNRKSYGDVSAPPYSFSRTIRTVDQFVTQQFLIKLSYLF